MAFFQDNLGKPATERLKPIWIYWCKRQWVAVASAMLHANLHFAPDW